jgi:F-type H+-transporting ATPase subunit b
MPQLFQLPVVFESQWFWLVLVLAVIYFGIARRMLPRIEKVVDDRNARIQSDLREAERARSKANEAEEQARAADLEARSRAQAITAAAKAEAAKGNEAVLASADAEIAGKVAAAEADIASARARALQGLERVAAEAARDIVAKVSGGDVSPVEAVPAVKAFLANG